LRRAALSGPGRVRRLAARRLLGNVADGQFRAALDGVRRLRARLADFLPVGGFSEAGSVIDRGRLEVLYFRFGGLGDLAVWYQFSLRLYRLAGAGYHC